MTNQANHQLCKDAVSSCRMYLHGGNFFPITFYIEEIGNAFYLCDLLCIIFAYICLEQVMQTSLIDCLTGKWCKTELVLRWYVLVIGHLVLKTLSTDFRHQHQHQCILS